jgi:hypothetical protein
MPRVKFEPSSSVFEQVKTHHALDRAANVIGAIQNELLKILSNQYHLHATCRKIYQVMLLCKRSRCFHCNCLRAFVYSCS